jgi:hypothetical protein
VKPPNLKKLRPQHEAFCLNFVARPHSAAKAWIAAGFAPASAKQMASAYLQDPLIKARVKELIEAKHKALHMDVDEILARAAVLARSGDVRRVLDENGAPAALHELDDIGAAAIAGFDWTETSTGKGDDKKIVTRVAKVRLRDPMPALRLLAEHKKLVKNDDAGVNALASAIADRLKAARERRRSKEPKP